MVQQTAFDNLVVQILAANDGGVPAGEAKRRLVIASSTSLNLETHNGSLLDQVMLFIGTSFEKFVAHAKECSKSDSFAVAERQPLFSFFECEVLPACYPQGRRLAGLQLHRAKQVVSHSF